MAHQYSCAACAFQVRSDDEAEVIDLVRTHAAESHDLELDESDVHDGMQSV